MFRPIRARRQARENQRRMDEWSAQVQQLWNQPRPVPAFPPAEPAPTAPEPPAAAPVVDDFLPPDLIAPSLQPITGMLFAWKGPLVIDGDVHACAQCGAYRDWVVLHYNEAVWLRCPAGHETAQPALDTVWFNAHSGPMTHRVASLDEGLKRLGH